MGHLQLNSIQAVLKDGRRFNAVNPDRDHTIKPDEQTVKGYTFRISEKRIPDLEELKGGIFQIEGEHSTQKGIMADIILVQEITGEPAAD